MSISIYLVLILAATVMVPVLDYIWLARVMQSFYLTELGPLARRVDGEFKPNIPAAVVVYLLLAVGLVCFVTSWADTWPAALGWGALLGFLIYGVYDMTNLSVLQGYSLKLSLLDMAWGTLLCGVVSYCLFYLRQWMS